MKSNNNDIYYTKKDNNMTSIMILKLGETDSQQFLEKGNILKIRTLLVNDKKNVIWNKTNKYGGITRIKYDNYYENCGYVVAYEIEKAILYNKQKDLKDFNVRTAPQSYVYITNKGVDPNE